ncbi:hypothetical protein, partial [Janthinobacterium sp.]|uniref:hypothetical protein n=1 Tax=Janthinobacterium sp. TaxID=1871054 RepID=UPI00293D4922
TAPRSPSLFLALPFPTRRRIGRYNRRHWASALLTALRRQNRVIRAHLYDDMYYPDFVMANTAIDELVDDKKVESEKVEVSSSAGAKFIVRKFSKK